MLLIVGSSGPQCWQWWERWLQNTLPDARGSVSQQAEKETHESTRKKKKKKTWLKTGKTDLEVLHPNEPPPIHVHTGVPSSWSGPEECLRGVTLCPLSLLSVVVRGLRLRARLQSLKFNISPPKNSTMKAGRAGRGRMSHPLLHSPQKKNLHVTLFFFSSCGFFYFRGKLLTLLIYFCVCVCVCVKSRNNKNKHGSREVWLQGHAV